MKHKELFKKLVLRLEELKKYSDEDISYLKIGINEHMLNKEALVYALNVYNLSYRQFDCMYPPEEVNIIFSKKIEIKAFYLLINIAKEVYDRQIYVYTHNFEEDKVNDLDVFFGSDITKNKIYSNISRAISAKKIISTELDSLNWEELNKIIPNLDNSVLSGPTYSWDQVLKEFNPYF